MWTFVDAIPNTTDEGQSTFNFTVTAGGAGRHFCFAYGCRANAANIATDFVRVDNASGADLTPIEEITQNDTVSNMAYMGHFSAASLADPTDTTIAVVVDVSGTSIRSVGVLWESAAGSGLNPTPFHSDEDSDPVNGGAASDLDFAINVAGGGSIIGFGFIGDVGGADAFATTGITEDEDGQTGAENARYVVAHTNGLSAETGRAVEFANSGAGTNLFSGVGIVSSWAPLGAPRVVHHRQQQGVQ